MLDILIVSKIIKEQVIHQPQKRPHSSYKFVIKSTGHRYPFELILNYLACFNYCERNHQKALLYFSEYHFDIFKLTLSNSEMTIPIN